MKKMRNGILGVTGLLYAVALTLAVSPACGTSTGNPAQSAHVTVSFGSYVASNWLYDLLVPSAMAAVSNLHLCLRRLRFKPASTSTVGDNVDLALGDVAVLTNGTSLTAVDIPAGTYQRVEFDLDTSCSSGYSVQLTNANGTFKSTDSMTIKFDGNLVASSSAASLTLMLQTIVTQLNNVVVVGDVKTYAEGSDGGY